MVNQDLKTNIFRGGGHSLYIGLDKIGEVTPRVDLDDLTCCAGSGAIEFTGDLMINHCSVNIFL